MKRPLGEDARAGGVHMDAQGEGEATQGTVQGGAQIISTNGAAVFAVAEGWTGKQWTGGTRGALGSRRLGVAARCGSRYVCQVYRDAAWGVPGFCAKRLCRLGVGHARGRLGATHWDVIARVLLRVNRSKMGQ